MFTHQNRRLFPRTPLAKTSCRRGATKPVRPSLTVEALEDRVVPTAVATVREATGATAAAIQTAVDAFRADLGTLNANVVNSFGNGRREINWDGVPDARSAPNLLPTAFFNTTSPRGAVFFTPGTGFQVSMDNDTPPDADPDLIEFDNLNPTYSTAFSVFSPQRLFTPLDSNTTDVHFFIPGSETPATVQGFGTVFTDVDTSGSTRIQFFDANDNLLTQRRRAGHRRRRQPVLPGDLLHLQRRRPRTDHQRGRVTHLGRVTQRRHPGRGQRPCRHGRLPLRRAGGR